MDKSFKLHVNASHVGAGGVLPQEHEFGIDRPVGFFSKTFNSHQLNYSVAEKEALALICRRSYIRTTTLWHFELTAMSKSAAC